jgi:hypothetical protein
MDMICGKDDVSCGHNLHCYCTRMLGRSGKEFRCWNIILILIVGKAGRDAMNVLVF